MSNGEVSVPKPPVILTDDDRWIEGRAEEIELSQVDPSQTPVIDS